MCVMMLLIYKCNLYG